MKEAENLSLGGREKLTHLNWMGSLEPLKEYDGGKWMGFTLENHFCYSKWWSSVTNFIDRVLWAINRINKQLW